jgi:hypothetical protein
MKNNLSEWLFQPFKRIAGIEAFVIGLIIAAFTAVIGSFSGVVFDGIIDVHFEKELTMSKSLICMVIDIVSLVLFMYLAGLIVAKGFRFVDMLGTMTLSRAPFILISIAGFIASPPAVQEIFRNPFVIFESKGFIVMMLLTIPVIFWVIILMYRAFTITTGVNNTKSLVAFSFAFFVAELISKLIILYIYIV